MQPGKPWTLEVSQDQSQQRFRHVNWPQNCKLINIFVWGLSFSCPIGFFLVTQQNSINISGVHGFPGLTVRCQVAGYMQLVVRELDIEQLGKYVGSVCLFFSMKVTGGHAH